MWLAESAAVRNERVLVLAVAVFRIAGLAQIAFAVPLFVSGHTRLLDSLMLAGAVAVESTVFIAVCLRRHRLEPSWVLADLAVNCAGLVAGAALIDPAPGHSPAYFMYPYTLLISIGIGATFRGKAQVAALASVLAVSFATSALVAVHDTSWTVLPDTLTYYANSCVAFVVAGALRRTCVETDAARTDAIEKADQLSTERERLRHARMLHDHVLQTMEMLARGAQIADDTVRKHVIAEAAWLRALVEGDIHNQRDGDLRSALVQVTQQRLDLQVEINTEQLRDTFLPPGVVRAVADVVHEALNNVAKHAGASAAIVHAGFDGDSGDLLVSVLDHGRGFSIADTSPGIGLAQSIKARIADIDGTVRIDSTPGAGTYIEVRVPRGKITR